MSETFTIDMVSRNASVLLTVHIKIKRPVDSPTDYVNRKRNFTLNCWGTVGYNYCFIDILIKWPGSAHDGWMYGSSSWDCLEMEPSQNAKESLSRGDLQYRYVSLGIQLILYYHFWWRNFQKGERVLANVFFCRRLSSAGMVIECAFGRLKVRCSCLRREMDTNLKELPAVIHSFFILHNFCEIRQEAINQNDVLVNRNYDVEFQPESGNRHRVWNQ